MNIWGGETAIITIVQPNFDSLEDNYDNLTTSHLGGRLHFILRLPTTFISLKRVTLWLRPIWNTCLKI